MWPYLVLIDGVDPWEAEQLLSALDPVMRIQRIPWGWIVHSDFQTDAILVGLRTVLDDHVLLLVAPINEGMLVHNVSLCS
jgi:hypothetical protein